MAVTKKKNLKCDILVAGGGLAGVSCALAAARCGSKVILCQDRPVLGGNASSEIRMHVVGADCSGARGSLLETEAREGGIIEEIRLENCVRNLQRSASMFDLILYDKCRSESNLDLMLNTAVTCVKRKKGLITHVVADRYSTEEQFTIAARIFVDCTGDGRLGAEAGASFRIGREGQQEYNESLAQPLPDSRTLGSTLLFQSRRHNNPMPYIAPSWIRKFEESDLLLRPHAISKADNGLEYGYWWVEWGGCLDTISDNELIRDELLAIMLGVWDHIKNGGDHGADNWALEWCGFLPGKRESRRFVGMYTLCEADVRGSGAFDDAIAYGGWYIDTHPPEGVDAPNKPPCEQHMVQHLYDIPLRACISKDIPNFMFAGRNISATHIAFASTRVMATCASIGQGVGTAASYAVNKKCLPSELSTDAHTMNLLQQRLLRDDVFLIGQKNEDQQDLARIAEITSSSEQEDGKAVNIISGQTRSVHGSNGATPNRANPGSHRWMSDPDPGLPAWIQLTWKKAVTPKTIQLVFDTGLHRMLTLTQAKAVLNRIVWGKPQPETVRDYDIEGLIEGTWQTLLEIKNNYLRRRIHTIKSPKPTQAIRVTVNSTNGLANARICEIRVYEIS